MSLEARDANDRDAAASARGGRRRVALVVVGVAAFFTARDLAAVSPRLRPLSAHGIAGFVRYTVGDYAGAAAAYRADLRATFATPVPVDDEHVALLPFLLAYVYGKTGRDAAAVEAPERVERLKSGVPEVATVLARLRGTPRRADRPRVAPSGPVR